MNRVTKLQALARMERAETSRVLARRICLLDRSGLPLPGTRYRLPSGPVVEMLAVVEDDSEARLRYVVDGVPAEGPENVVGFSLAWLLKNAAVLAMPLSENAAP